MLVVMMPLVAGRTVMITVAREDDKTLRMTSFQPSSPATARTPRSPRR